MSSLRSRNSTVKTPIQPLVAKSNHCSTHQYEVKSLLISKYICVQKGCIRKSLQKASREAFNGKTQCETHLCNLRWNNVLQCGHLVSMRCKFLRGRLHFNRVPCLWFFNRKSCWKCKYKTPICFSSWAEAAVWFLWTILIVTILGVSVSCQHCVRNTAAVCCVVKWLCYASE